MLRTFEVKTNNKVEFLDITKEVERIVDMSNTLDGICTVFIPHTTAGITINENADPDVREDFLMELDKIVPLKDNYKHMEGNSAAHIKASMMGLSQTLIIEEGKLLLGTWQGIYLCEFDGPRTRKVHVKIMENYVGEGMI